MRIFLPIVSLNLAWVDLPLLELVVEQYTCACPTLAITVIVEAAFRLTPGSTAASRADRSAFRAARAWMSGLRCAGSVFKNPPGHVAGRLIEEAGWKGAALGGARVSARHANILVAETGCRASDLMALIDLIRESVARRTGLRLELELAIPAPPPEWLPDLAD